MDKLIELLQQIQELAGVGVDALKGAAGGGEKPSGGERPGGGAPEPDADERGGPSDGPDAEPGKKY